jgi:methylthioribose-1-phosphate isomerase
MDLQKTLWYEKETERIGYIDETLLPGFLETAYVSTIPELGNAISTLAIRGAPALGVAGAFGVALCTRTSTATSLSLLLDDVKKNAEWLRSTRPTAVNLSWGINRVLRIIMAAKSLDEARSVALSEASLVAREDAETCRQIGEHGAALLPDRGNVLTHCNAGALACSEWGTALGMVRSAVAGGKEVRVIACETRPLLQGARLTSWELARDGIAVTVITDSAAASLMKRGEIDCVIVGADRITSDAVFNKIGTYMHAVCARSHALPFYVAAPVSTLDPAGKEQDIIVEERKREEITLFSGRKTVPDNVPVRNPAFDATPLNLVSAIITEYGVHTPPYDITGIAREHSKTIEVDGGIHD